MLQVGLVRLLDRREVVEHADGVRPRACHDEIHRRRYLVDQAYADRIKRLHTEKQTYEAEKENLFRAVERGIATDELLDRIKQKQHDIERVNVRIKDAENNKPKEIDEEGFRQLVKKTKKLIKNRDVDELRRFISFYIDRIEIGKDDITVILSFSNIVLLLGGGGENLNSASARSRAMCVRSAE